MSADVSRGGQGEFHTVSLSQLIQRGIIMLVRVRAVADGAVSGTVLACGRRVWLQTSEEGHQSGAVDYPPSHLESQTSGGERQSTSWGI